MKIRANTNLGIPIELMTGTEEETFLFLKKHDVIRRSHRQIGKVEEVLYFMAPSSGGKKMSVPRITEAILLPHIVVRVIAMFDTLAEAVDGRGRA
jgi:hypothetical protein